MNPNVSVCVVVTTRDSDRTLRACLESIRSQSTKCELIVVDNASTDHTREIALELADSVIDTGPERSRQRNVGMLASDADIVGFIDSDMRLEAEVVHQAIDLLLGGSHSVVVPEITIGVGFWAQVSAFERAMYAGSHAIEAPRFFWREEVAAIGGWDEDMTGAEDWDLAVRSRGLGPRKWTTASIVHDEGRVRLIEVCRKKAYYSSGVARFVKKHPDDASQVLFARPWLRQPSLLLNRLGLGLLVMKSMQAIFSIQGFAAFEIRRLRTRGVHNGLEQGM